MTRTAAVAVQLTGGLGNQLFQYAAGRALADRRGVPLELDLRQLAFPGRTGFQLASLPVRAERMIGPSRLAQAALATREAGPAARLTRRYLTATVERPPAGFAAWSPRTFAYDAGIDEAPDRVWLRGHFQSERYFADDAARIAGDLRVPGSGNPQPAAAAVALHVRRGDYLAAVHAGRHPVLPLSYYTQALASLGERFPGAAVTCYSDSHDWAEAHLGPMGVQVARTDAAEAPIEDLLRISRSDAVVIANSSYSWWAAWLSTARAVVAPDVWFGDDTDTRDLLPSRWERLQVAA